MGKAPTLASREPILDVTERLEDAIARVVKHHQDRTIESGKASKITIDMVVKTDNKRRTGFSISIKDKVTLAEPPSEEYFGKLYFKFNDDGEPIEAFDSDPEQLRMNLDGDRGRTRA